MKFMFWKNWNKPKSYLLEDKFEIIPAFEWQGETYYMHRDPLTMLAGRGLTSLVFMEEIMMRCDVKYLKDHIAANKQIFNDPKKIDLTKLVQLNTYLEERVNMLAAIPDHVYKMASVVFFTKHESPFRYDYKVGIQRVQAWKEAPGMYDFFLQTPLKDLIPSLGLPEQDSHTYLQVVEKVNNLHLKNLQELLSRKG